MPVTATSVGVSRDGQYVFAAGVYKPRIRCYDLAQLSMKFERCVDAEVTALSLLSDDYTKVSPAHPCSYTYKTSPQFVMLLANRQLEFHTQVGKPHPPAPPPCSVFSYVVWILLSYPCA